MSRAVRVSDRLGPTSVTADPGCRCLPCRRRRAFDAWPDIVRMARAGHSRTNISNRLGVSPWMVNRLLDDVEDKR